ncbi:DUF2213 domain-containing protein [Hafnia alvei]|nr:DUF2213 domain-containing protein [Hafnia alvei]MBI0275419.1 DUF2213 domain-containing protein [Hafnia alvei]PNK98588.1 hypothetical protein CEQ28_013835 [Hafnia alvei]
MTELLPLHSQLVRFFDEGEPEPLPVKTQQMLAIGDRMTIPSQRTFRDSGEMIAPCTIARTGIMLYRARDCGDLFADRDPDSLVRVMTTEEELFAPESMESYRSCPVTIGHPRDKAGNQIDVTLDNNKELQKGFLEGMPIRDGSNLGGNIVVNAKDALKIIDEGVDQLSSGQDCILVRVTDQANKDWDAEKTHIRANHIAICEQGRAGTAKIADAVVVDPTKYVLVSEFERLQAQHDADVIKIASLNKKLSDALAEIDEVKDVAAKAGAKATNLESKLSSTEARLHDALAKISTDTDIINLVEEKASGRVALLAQVARLGDDFTKIDVKGKSEIDIKREVLASMTDEDLSNKTDNYIEVRFDIALADSMEVTLGDALASSMLSNEEPAKPKAHTNPAAEAKARRAERYNK